MKVCEWKFSFSFAYIREKFFFEFSSFYQVRVLSFPFGLEPGRAIGLLENADRAAWPNMKKIRESCQTGLAKTWLCSSLRDKILPVNRNDNPRINPFQRIDFNSGSSNGLYRSFQIETCLWWSIFSMTPSFVQKRAGRNFSFELSFEIGKN